jgi:hypothetical protein
MARSISSPVTASPPISSAVVRPLSSAAIPSVFVAALLLLRLPALLAPLRRIKTLLAEERLLLGAEGELTPAVGARQTLFAHFFLPFFVDFDGRPIGRSVTNFKSLSLRPNFATRRGVPLPL